MKIRLDGPSEEAVDGAYQVVTKHGGSLDKHSTLKDPNSQKPNALDMIVPDKEIDTIRQVIGGNQEVKLIILSGTEAINTKDEKEGIEPTRVEQVA